MSQKRFPAKVVECRVVTTVELENGFLLELIGARIPQGSVISLIADKLMHGNDLVNFGGYEVLYRPHGEPASHQQPYAKPPAAPTTQQKQAAYTCAA